MEKYNAQLPENGLGLSFTATSDKLWYWLDVNSCKSQYEKKPQIIKIAALD